MTDLNISIFKERRAKVASQMESNSILMLCSSNIVPRNNDTTFPFRQDSNFYYLTGFQEPDSILTVQSDGRSVLFCRKKNSELEKWDGFMWGPDAAKDHFGFDEAHDISEINEILPNVKMIFSVCDPAERFFSEWRHRENTFKEHVKYHKMINGHRGNAVETAG